MEIAVTKMTCRNFVAIRLLLDVDVKVPCTNSVTDPESLLSMYEQICLVDLTVYSSNLESYLPN
jgi:hypothetical protein